MRGMRQRLEDCADLYLFLLLDIIFSFHLLQKAGTRFPFSTINYLKNVHTLPPALLLLSSGRCIIKQS